MNNKLLILNDHFYPGYKGGGPIQSLNNLVVTLEAIYSISVIASAYDLHSDESFNDIRADEWNTIILPSCSYPISVWYGNKKSPDKKRLRQLFHQVNPAFIYLNGILSYRFFMLPLIVLKQSGQNSKVIICPRGMLQHGALSGKLFTKALYLNFLKVSRLLKNVHWHATNHEEKEDIIKTFGKRQPVYIAGNIPKKPLSLIKNQAKKVGELHLVYLSLIAEKKNLLLVLEMLKKCNGITLDIYGPVKDVAYWKQCKKLIDQIPGKVKYKGEIIPGKVQETFEQYDASILLTKGENFGHALYESLSVGRPVITSHFTPWINLQQQKAGWNIDISFLDQGVSLLKDLSETPPEVFNEYCIGAHHLAKDYYSQLHSIVEYRKLFS